jgi:hypothetical protein
LEDLPLEDGDLLGMGFMPDLDASDVTSRADRIDDVFMALLERAERGLLCGVLCRWRK